MKIQTRDNIININSTFQMWWRLPVRVASMGVGIALGITQQRANKKRLDEVLQQIEKLRG